MIKMVALISLGADYDGVTDISLDYLRTYGEKKLKAVKIDGNGSMDVHCFFIFEDDTSYMASGFSIGYGGEGPWGLYRAISIFHPDAFADFSGSGIAELNNDSSYTWTPEYGFETTI